MNYHEIRTNDMLNGAGLRVVLFLSGCEHNCKNCHNPQTHNPSSGKGFELSSKEEIFNELKHDYVSGLTLSGGDPLHKENLNDVLDLVNQIRLSFGETKTIWLYTGYEWFDIFTRKDTCSLQFLDPYDMKRREIIRNCDVVVDGRFIQELADINYPFAGSTNQRLIDVKRTLETGEVVLYKI